MDFVNRTDVSAGWTMGFDRDGRELVIVVVKATFAIPSNGEEPSLAEEQAPLVAADQFTGEPGLSAPLYECDYAHRKPMCDVLVNGSAYAPRGKKASRVTVGMRVGPMVKSFVVVGDRVWRSGITGIRATEPQPFDVMSISYDNAFGGVDDSNAASGKTISFLDNPVGRGYSHFKDNIDGKALPNTEELDGRVTSPDGSYRPMALGPIGRHWRPRVQYAGTYDQSWVDNRAPFWPDDFDYRFFQSAPPDQQIPYPTGGEDVVLNNLTPAGHVAFRLPHRPVPVWFLPYRGKDTRVNAKIDSIVIEPDRARFAVGSRAVLPMRRSCFDVKQIIVGEMSEAWQRARKYGNKPYYRGLGELVQAKRRKH